MQKSQVFIVFNKPFQTGVFNSSLNICGEETNIDTTFLPAFGGMALSNAKVRLGFGRCSNLPFETDLQPGTLSLSVEGPSREATISVQNVSFSFKPFELPEHSPFAVRSTENGIITYPPAKG